MKLSPFDVGIICAYFLVVLGVGYYLKDKMRTSSDFLLTNHSLSHWVTGIAFMSANLGSLEVMGHIANGAKYGMRTNHWYWTGAIPAMVFLGIFMVRYYYANGVRSVPEYLRRRYDYRAHPLGKATTVMQFLTATALLFEEPAARPLAIATAAVGAASVAVYLNRARLLARADR